MDLNLVTKKELADSLRCSERTIDRMRREGLPSYNMGKIMFDKQEAIEWIKNNRKEK